MKQLKSLNINTNSTTTMMSSTNKLLITLLGVCWFGLLHAQNAFTLKEAQDYAVKNNISNLNAQLDYESAVAKKNETRGIGLPQISGSFDFKDFLKIPTSLIPGTFIGRPAGTFIPVKFGTKYNATAGLSVSQILFSSDYIVALQATKGYLELSEKSSKRTAIETKVNVGKAYYGALVNKYRLQSLTTNISNLEQTIEQMKAMRDVGFIESIDVQRLEVTYNNLVVEKEKVERLIGLSEVLLKFQMGYDMNQPISLTDTLSLSQIPTEDASDLNKANPSNRIEYEILKGSLDLQKLSLKRAQYSYLPTLAAYGSLQKNALRSKFNILNEGPPWYPTSLIGLTLNVPVFDGFQKHFRIQQASLDYKKAQNALKQFEQVASLETASAQATYNNAIKSFKTNKNNIELAESVLKTVQIKVKEGVSNNLELINAQTTLTTSQINMYDALYNFLVAKIDLDKAQGNIK
jgi:outer membrane protein TolC